MSITYYIGNLTAKRRYMREGSKDSIYADNDDILGYFRLCGKLYCLPASLPFANMRVRDFIRYKRALSEENCRPMTRREMLYLMKLLSCRLPLGKKVGTLSRIDYRHLCLVANFRAGTNKIGLNLDGLPYSLFARRKLRGLLAKLSRLFDVRVSVSDSRFIPKDGRTVEIDPLGAEKAAQKSVRARTVSKKVLSAYFRNNAPFGGIDFSVLSHPVLVTE